MKTLVLCYSLKFPLFKIARRFIVLEVVVDRLIIKTVLPLAFEGNMLVTFSTQIYAILTFVISYFI